MWEDPVGAEGTWIEDESRNQLALWFGRFDSEAQLRQYAFKDFRKGLHIPMTWQLETFYLKTCFSAKPGDVPALIGKLRNSQSFLAAVKRAAKKHKIAKYNGAIAIFDYFTDARISDNASGAEFIGFFKYETYAESLISTKPSYLNDKRVSVWFGTFASKTAFESYFNLPDHVPPQEDFDFKSPFAEDFKIKTYNEEFAAYNLSRGMRPKGFKDLIAAIPMSSGLLKSMLEAAADQQVSEGNAVYVAFRLDYDDVRSGLKKSPRSRFDFKYLGTFDDPGQVRRRGGGRRTHG